MKSLCNNISVVTHVAFNFECQLVPMMFAWLVIRINAPCPTYADNWFAIVLADYIISCRIIANTL